jgi:hypothetical protein
MDRCPAGLPPRESRSAMQVHPPQHQVQSCASPEVGQAGGSFGHLLAAASVVAAS